jgi:hypothetical protein
MSGFRLNFILRKLTNLGITLARTVTLYGDLNCEHIKINIRMKEDRLRNMSGYTCLTEV